MHALYRDNQKKSDRIKAILLLDKGFSYGETAEILLIDDATVRRWHSTFSTEGIKILLKDNYRGGECKLGPDELSELSFHLNQKIYLTAKAICAHVNPTCKF